MKTKTKFDIVRSYHATEIIGVFEVKSDYYFKDYTLLSNKPCCMAVNIDVQI